MRPIAIIDSYQLPPFYDTYDLRPAIAYEQSCTAISSAGGDNSLGVFTKTLIVIFSKIKSQNNIRFYLGLLHELHPKKEQKGFCNVP